MSPAPRTLTDAVQLRWRPVSDPAAEQSVEIDSVDFGPDGEPTGRLHARFRFSPDSKRRVAVCAMRLLIVDVVSGEYREINFGDRRFSDAGWLSNDELLIITDSGFAWDFWRLDVDSPSTDAENTHEEPYVSASSSWDQLPQPAPGEMTGRFDFSPDGERILFRRVCPDYRQMEAVMHVESTGVTPLLDYVGGYSWKADGSAMLISGSLRSDDGVLEAIVMVIDFGDGDPRSMTGQDLTESFAAAFGEEAIISLTAPRWTPDGEHVLIRSVLPAQLTEDKDTIPAVRKDHLVRIDPWTVVLTRDEMLYWSPNRRTVLAGDEDSLVWLGFDGEDLGGAGDADERIWSQDGRYAAWVDEGEVIVFDLTISPAEQ